MYRFWDTIIEPILVDYQPKIIVEVGSSSGVNTKNLLGFCEQNNSFCHTIDPTEIGNYNIIKDDLDKYGKWHKLLSLDALKNVMGDVFLLDGDHNWYTVYEELKLIEANVVRDNLKLPLIFFHDTNWPYHRRDLYYDPATIPDEHKKPFAYKGIVPNRSELSETEGINSTLSNATTEGGEHNGVLTGVEDFLQNSSFGEKYTFCSVPHFHGLGLLYPTEQLQPSTVKKINQHFNFSEAVVQILQSTENERIKGLLAQDQLRRQLHEMGNCLHTATQQFNDLNELWKDQSKMVDDLNRAMGNKSFLRQKMYQLGRSMFRGTKGR